MGNLYIKLFKILYSMLNMFIRVQNIKAACAS